MEFEKKECRMVLVKVLKRGERLPFARIIVIALREKVKQYAEKELMPYIPKQSVLPLADRCMFIYKDLGGIFFWPYPATVFLHSNSDGQIK